MLNARRIMKVYVDYKALFTDSTYYFGSATCDLPRELSTLQPCHSSVSLLKELSSAAKAFIMYSTR